MMSMLRRNDRACPALRGVLLALLCGVLHSGYAAAQDAPAEPTEANRQTQGSVRDLGGWTTAAGRMGEHLPTGKGILFGHVEGNPGSYMPDTSNGRFGDVSFVPRSGESEPFGHATSTAAVIYGPKGLAPGIAEVHCYTSANWLGGSFLRTGTPLPPAKSDIRVFTHSWIAGDNPHTEEVLRRVDHLVDRDDVLVFAGVNNGRNTAIPALLGSAYNVVAVGTGEANGASSGGYTRFDGPGRSKPDLVGPRHLTSFATPAVAAAGAMLLERADAAPFYARASARRSEVIKAALLSGATKPWNWQPRDNHPLDEHLGAGVVNVDNALRILDGGPVEPGRVSQPFGWSLRTMSPGTNATYQFVVDGEPKPLAVTLTWHRRIDGRTAIDPESDSARWLDTPRLADFDLLLSRQIAGSQIQVVKLSNSRVDNVEHIYIPRLEPGVYRLDIIRRRDGQNEPWDVALAWRHGGEAYPDGLAELAAEAE